MYHVRTETFFYRTDNGLNRDEVSSFHTTNILTEQRNTMFVQASWFSLNIVLLAFLAWRWGRHRRVRSQCSAPGTCLVWMGQLNINSYYNHWLISIILFVCLRLRYWELIPSSNVEVEGGGEAFSILNMSDWLPMHTFQKSWVQYQHIPTHSVKSVKELFRCREQWWESVTFWCGSSSGSASLTNGSGSGSGSNSGFRIRLHSSVTLRMLTLSSALKITFLQTFFVKILFCKHLFMIKGKDPDPDLYLWPMDPDPCQPKNKANPADPDPQHW